ncbi:anti-FecI sigma factor, FecR [Fibrisoma limi BUZ 3]|uniref:Anti-FecI sigma factor, FecR n=1 Tax=Fibrisoma limi BUZ 3 TaxID=1185876 RepID=I2GKI0_9BACT|nr:FecR family protein [Fibrisoma limi]CCH54405.1 anti-FecI sigma factor, FecR [Fibrisoma limi BUZ 3]
MKNYETYTVADFIQDESFQEWVQGQGNRQSFWLSFPERYPEKQEAFRQAEQFIRAATVAPERISDAEIRRETEKLIESASSYSPYRQLVSSDLRDDDAPTPFRYAFRWGMAVAAVVAVVSGLMWYGSLDKPGQLPAQLREAPINQLVETINNTRHPLRVVLTDGSDVLLSPKSRLRYPSHFATDSRVVHLTGEASFSVTRRNQPFMVYSGETVTKVLGTRFVVRAFDSDQKITVQVLSGKVSVYKARVTQKPGNKEVSGLILHANQAAIFEKSDGNLTKTLVANPAVVSRSSQETQFVYDAVALSVILRQLEKSYGIPIQFDEQNFQACRITATLSNESLYEKLDLLCKAASATYQITDGQIVISRQAIH